MKYLLYFTFIAGTLIFSGNVFWGNFKNFIQNASYFQLDKVQIYGLNYLKGEEILATSGLKRYDSLLFINKKELKEKIESLKKVEVESIIVSLPHTLVLNLKENEGVFILKNDTNFFEINENRELIAKNEEIKNMDKIIISFEDVNSSVSNVLSREDLKNLVDGFLQIPTNEKDFFTIISHCIVGENVEMFLREKNQKIILDRFFDLNQLRKARFAYVYSLNQTKNIYEIDVRGDLVKYRFL